MTNATLVVAKLDRLARNSYFLNCLLHSKLDFVCCDNPYADKFNIQVLAAVAEHEADQIAARTKAALAAAKVKGKLLGSSRPGHWEGREHLRDAGIEKAQPMGRRPTRRMRGIATRECLCPRLSAAAKRASRW